jgi:hypothetical protein
MNNITIDIEKIKQDINNAEIKKIRTTKQTTKQVVLELKKDIAKLKKKGYSIDDIALFLNERGLKISSGTLKSYLNGNKKNKSTTAKKEIGTNTSDNENKTNITNNNTIQNNNKFPLKDGQV